MTYKIIRRLRPVIQANGKVKRTGQPYYEVAYFTNTWHFKEFNTSKQAKEFVTLV